MKLHIITKKQILAAFFLACFLMTAFWWNNTSWEFRKSDFSINEERLALETNGESYSLTENQLQKQISRLSTQVLLQYLSDFFHFQSATIYEVPGTAYETYTDWGTVSTAISELERRKDGARTILAAYQACPVWGQKDFDEKAHSWTGELAVMELLLSQPEFQENLTQEEIDSLPSIAVQKQKEKYSYPSYQRPECNLLYTDTYCRPSYPIVFGHCSNKNLEHFMWDFDVLEKQDEMMRSQYNSYHFYHPVNRYLAKLRQKKFLTRIHLPKNDPNIRFDNCQVTQP